LLVVDDDDVYSLMFTLQHSFFNIHSSTSIFIFNVRYSAFTSTSMDAVDCASAESSNLRWMELHEHADSLSSLKVVSIYIFLSSTVDLAG